MYADKSYQLINSVLVDLSRLINNSYDRLMTFVSLTEQKINFTKTCKILQLRHLSILQKQYLQKYMTFPVDMVFISQKHNFKQFPNIIFFLHAFELMYLTSSFLRSSLCILLQKVSVSSRY